MKETFEDFLKAAVLNEKFRDFREKAVAYVAKPNANAEVCFVFGQICVMDEEVRIDFMRYIFDYWYAYTLDIINGTYKYVSLTSAVWNAWVELESGINAASETEN